MISQSEMVAIVITDEVLENAVETFLAVRKAHENCSPEIKLGVDEMLGIIESLESSPDEKAMAMHTVIEALFHRKV